MLVSGRVICPLQSQVFVEGSLHPFDTCNTVDERNPAPHESGLCHYLHYIQYALCIPGGVASFPSTFFYVVFLSKNKFINKVVLGGGIQRETRQYLQGTEQYNMGTIIMERPSLETNTEIRPPKFENRYQKIMLWKVYLLSTMAILGYPC